MDVSSASSSTTVEFDLRDVQQEKENQLGKGIYGRICAVKYAGTRYAAQEFQQVNSRDRGRIDLERSLLQECHHVWSKVRHPNIVLFIGVWRRPESPDSFPVIVTESMQYSQSLRSLLDDSHDEVSKVNLLPVFGDVSLGLRYLHFQSPPIVHCSVIPDNILLQSSTCEKCGEQCGHCIRAKITNVGVAKVMKLTDCSDQQNSTYLPFIPPEGRNDNPQYEPSFDVFAFGSLLWYTGVTSNLPEQPEMSKDPAIVEKQLKDFLNNLDVTLEDGRILRSLVGDCWNLVPNERPSIAQVSETIQRVKV